MNGQNQNIVSSRELRIFFSRCLLVLLPVILCAACILGVGNLRIDSNVYMNAMIEKHKKAEMIKGPKIIMTGGSSVAFGIDSKELQDSLKMPVVNLGMHAALGLNFILAEASKFARNGDVI